MSARLEIWFVMFMPLLAKPTCTLGPAVPTLLSAGSKLFIVAQPVPSSAQTSIGWIVRKYCSGWASAAADIKVATVVDNAIHTLPPSRDRNSPILELPALVADR